MNYRQDQRFGLLMYAVLPSSLHPLLDRIRPYHIGWINANAGIYHAIGGSYRRTRNAKRMRFSIEYPHIPKSFPAILYLIWRIVVLRSYRRGLAKFQSSSCMKMLTYAYLQMCQVYVFDDLSQDEALLYIILPASVFSVYIVDRAEA